MTNTDRCSLCHKPHDKHHKLCPVVLGQKILDERNTARTALVEICDYPCTHSPAVSELKRIARKALEEISH